jgi:hypothetical protein
VTSLTHDETREAQAEGGQTGRPTDARAPIPTSDNHRSVARSHGPGIPTVRRALAHRQLAASGRNHSSGLVVDYLAAARKRLLDAGRTGERDSAGPTVEVTEDRRRR